MSLYLDNCILRAIWLCCLYANYIIFFTFRLSLLSFLFIYILFYYVYLMTGTVRRRVRFGDGSCGYRHILGSCGPTFVGMRRSASSRRSKNNNSIFLQIFIFSPAYFFFCCTVIFLFHEKNIYS